jgi:hypothetical protein
MSDPEFDEESPRPERRQGGAQSDKASAFRAQSVLVLREFFDLLEEHAPVWYTEQHHDRAVVALRILDELSSGHGLEAIEAQSPSVASQIVKKVPRLLPDDLP